MNIFLFIKILLVLIGTQNIDASEHCDQHKTRASFFGLPKNYDQSGCNIAQLDLGDLEERPELIAIDASKNDLSKIYNATFENAVELLYIDLSFNRISEMEARSFNGISKLTHLNMSENLLETLEKGIFDPLVSLLEIRLDNNRIKVLKNGLFLECGALELVNLTSNKIEAMERKVFIGSLKYQNLMFRENSCVKKNFRNTYYNEMYFKDCLVGSSSLGQFRMWNTLSIIKMAIIFLVNFY
jgi:hypothetical protein